jgi:hypothetical protein
MIEGSYIVPKESFTGVCKEMQELADLMLKLAVAMNREQQTLADDSQALKYAMKATSQVRYVETLMRAIIEENGGPPDPINGNNLGGEDESGGGQACAGS